jgi:hypothetical protein
MKRPRADFNIIRLEQRASLFIPEMLETQNDFLKSGQEKIL